MQKLTCKCETSFESRLPDEIDLDTDTECLSQILDGVFFSVKCPSCGEMLKPEIAVRLVSRLKGTSIQVFPEIDRLSFQLGQITAAKGCEVLIGYPELFERARIMVDNLDPDAIEIIKYYLRLKAEDSAPEAPLIEVSYAGILHDSKPSAAEKLAFHIAGIREGEIAVLPVTLDYYRKIAADKAKTMKTDPFSLIFKGAYRSIRILEAPAE